MKKTLLLAFLFAVNSIWAQCEVGLLTFTDQDEVDAFAVNYPDCTELIGGIVLNQSDGTPTGPPITNLNAFQNLVSVSGGISIVDTEITSLSGLDNITGVGGNFILSDYTINDISALSGLLSIGGDLKLKNMTITSLTAFNDLQALGGTLEIDLPNLQELDIELNIDILQGNLILYLPDSITSISGFDNITTVEGDMTIQGSGLLSLAGFASLESIGGSLNILYLEMLNLDGFVSLTSIGGLLHPSQISTKYITGFNSLESVGGVFLDNCALLESISGLNSLTQINSQHLRIKSCGSLTSLMGLHNLESLNTSTIYIYNNDALTDISAIQYIDPQSITYIDITSNSMLSECSILSICEYMVENDVIIHSNGPGCDNVEEVTEGCTGTFNTITGLVTTYFQVESCDNPEFGIGGAQIIAVDNDGQYFITYTEPDGTYVLYVPAGEYSMTATAGNFMVIQNWTILFPGAGDEASNDYCIGDGVEISDDMRVAVYPVNEARPGFDSVYTIVCENVGTTPQSGSVTFTFDVSKTSSVSSFPEGVINSGQITWDFALNPYQSTTYTVTLGLQAPPVNNNDDVLSFIASVSSDGDDTPVDNEYTLNQVLVGSYDPNDKTVMDAELPIQNAGEYLTYRIRFQNTGTASAINILLEDELDMNLDFSTFKPVAASHPNYRVDLVDNMLKVYFDNIDLPAEEDDQVGSNGFFMYQVKSNDDIQVGDIITNTAGIYFDFNTPIITNTVTTEVVWTAGIAGNNLLDVSVSPNPANSVLNFKAATAIVSVELYNGLGQKVTSLNAEAIESLNVAQLANGVYFCHLHDGYGNTSIQKIIINK